MTFKTLLTAAAFGTLLSGAAFANVEYDCGEVDGILLGATYFEEEDMVQVTGFNQFGETQTMDLFPVRTGSGSRFENGQVALVQHQGRTFLETEGFQANCSVFAVSEPGFGTTVLGNSFPGFSFGGNLRSGPDMNFEDVGSTFNGQQLTLISDTGQSFNGFNWWLVQLPNGQQAYQWGGLLCAPQHSLNGVFNDGC